VTSVVVAAGHREKTKALRTDAGRSSSGRRTVKASERSDSGRRQQPCNGSAGLRHSSEQEQTASGRRSSEATADESSYYVQSVAPVLDEMARRVHMESFRCMCCVTVIIVSYLTDLCILLSATTARTCLCSSSNGDLIMPRSPHDHAISLSVVLQPGTPCQ